MKIEGYWTGELVDVKRGMLVRYKPVGHDAPEYGIVTDTTSATLIRVRFYGDHSGKSCRPEDLTAG